MISDWLEATGTQTLVSAVSECRQNCTQNGDTWRKDTDYYYRRNLTASDNSFIYYHQCAAISRANQQKNGLLLRDVNFISTRRIVGV